jgi:hypothetical protein
MASMLARPAVAGTTGAVSREDRIMRRDNAGSAVAARDDGLRRVTRLTWQAGAASVVCSALIAAAFGHGVASGHATTRTGTGQHGRGAILIPAQPPAPAAGSGQVTSGAS